MRLLDRGAGDPYGPCGNRLHCMGRVSWRARGGWSGVRCWFIRRRGDCRLIRGIWPGQATLLLFLLPRFPRQFLLLSRVMIVWFGHLPSGDCQTEGYGPGGIGACVRREDPRYSMLRVYVFIRLYAKPSNIVRQFGLPECLSELTIRLDADALEPRVPMLRCSILGPGRGGEICTCREAMRRIARGD